MSSLQDYLDSKYIQQLKLFAKDRKRDFVFVYVEGDEDIGFWDYALNQFGNQTKFQFLVSTNKKSVFGGEDTNGKDVLLRMQNLGPNKIVCVDADLDLIVDDYSVHTYKVREDDYVVNTTYYSIENILASEFFYVPLSRNLKIIEPIETYKNMLRWISLACLDIFLLLLSYSKEKGENKIFWFKDFVDCLGCISFDDLGDFSKLQLYKESWNNKYQSLLTEKQTEIFEIHRKLHEAGYTDDMFFVLMRGHDLYNYVVKLWFEKVVNKRITHKIEIFKGTHNAAEIKEYRNNLFQELGSYKSLRDAINSYFYNNKPNPLILPKQTKDKILRLFS